MLRLLLPAVVLAAALAGGAGWLGEPPPPPVLLQVSRGLLALVFLLAWRFRRGRLAWLAASLAAAQELLRPGVLTATTLERVVLPAVALLLPAHVAAAGFLSERRVATRASALRFAVLAAEAAAVLLLARPRAAPAAAWLRAPLLDLPWLSPTPLPQPALVAFAVAAVLLAVRLARRREPWDAGLLAVLAAVLVALGGGGAYGFGTAGLLLGLTLVESAVSLAFEDGLTGLPARRALEGTLLDLGGSYAIAMVDVDRFKRLNDRHGHEVGDQVLRMVARRLARVGGGGTAFRYGGEEFAVIFPGKTAAEAEPHLEELRREIASYRFAVRAPDRPRTRPETPPRGHGSRSRELKVTVSLGIAGPGRSRPSPHQVLKAADRALYRAKRAGRNRLVRAQ